MRESICAEMADQHPLIGKEIGPWTIVKELGRGGLGAVFLAEHSSTCSLRALKVIHPHLSANKRIEQVRLIYNELAELEHENLRRVYGFKEEAGIYYIELEYIKDPMDLRALLKERGALSVNESLKFLRQLCRGLAYAHRRGAVHRDLKPEHVFLDLFNSSEDHFLEASKTLEEQSFEPDIDIPSLGAYLFGLLTGRRSRSAKDHNRSVSVPGLPLWLSNIILRMIHGPCYSNIDAVLNDLDKYSKENRKSLNHPLIGEKIESYEVLEKLSETTSGELFLVKSGHGKEWRLSILTTVLPGQSKVHPDLHLFKKTGVTPSQVEYYKLNNHVNLLTQNNTVYLEVSSVDDHAIDRRLKTLGVFDEMQAIHLVRQACKGVKNSHFNDFRETLRAHRVHWADSLLKISDFGIKPSNDLDLCSVGVLVKSPSYMSPEQCRGLKIDCRSDIYSLGVIFYEMLTGKRPFSGETVMEIMYKHIESTPVLPHQVNPEVPKVLSEVTLKMMEKDADKRYQSCDEIIQDLDRILARSSPERLEELNKQWRGQYFIVKEMNQSRRTIDYHAIDQKNNNRHVKLTVLDGDAFSDDYKDLNRRHYVCASLFSVHFPRVYKQDTSRAFPFLVEEYVFGTSLRDRVNREGPLSDREVLDIGLWTLIALRMLHDKGFCHNEVHPDNIILTSTRTLKLLGGQLKALDSKLELNEVAAQCVAPEQIETPVITLQSELYAVGVSLYFAATGCWPYSDSESRDDLYILKKQAPPKDPIFVNDKLSAACSDLIMALISSSPNNRYDSTVDALMDFKWAAAGNKDRSPLSRKKKPFFSMRALGIFTALAASLAALYYCQGLLL
jgi:serine/threonine protein kinase